MSHKAKNYNHVAIQHQYIPVDHAEDSSEHVNNFKKATEDSVMFKDMDKSYRVKTSNFGRTCKIGHFLPPLT